MDLEKKLQATPKVAVSPEIFDLSKREHRQKLSVLFENNKIGAVINDYRKQCRELFAADNPPLVYSPDFEAKAQAAYLEQLRGGPEFYRGRWAYFPWSQTLAHILIDGEFQRLRTARNKNLINEAEQEKFYRAVIGIGGLSVGNSAALAIALQGGARRIKLADHDNLELSNTNRVRAGVTSLGLPKVVVTARQIYELNPYAKVEIFTEGLTEKNLGRFFRGTAPLNVFVDELDNLAVKFLIREKARHYRVPVVMAADNGDNGIVDVERYDLNPKTKFFHGRLGSISHQELKGLTKFETGKLIVKLLDINNITPRTGQSFMDMGKTLASWPQLGGAAQLNGAAVAYAVRQITAGHKFINGRSILSLDELLLADYRSPAQKKSRQKALVQFKRFLNF